MTIPRGTGYGRFGRPDKSGPSVKAAHAFASRPSPYTGAGRFATRKQKVKRSAS